MTAMNGSYELYDKNGVHRMSLEDELHSPPGGPSCRPPGSPVLRKEIEMLKQERIQSQQEINKLKTWNEDLLRKLKGENCTEAMGGNDDVSNASSVDEDVRDSRIRYLQRQVTILQANVHKKDLLEKRMMEVIEEKNLSDDRLREATKLMEAIKKEKDSLGEKMVKEIRHLQSVIRQQKEEIERLQADKAINKSRVSVLSREGFDSSSSSSSSSSSPTAGANSLQSMASVDSQLYSRELDSLHRVVDMLRATVMDQRNVLIKLGLANKAFASSASESQQSSAMSASMPVPNNYPLSVRPVGDANNMAITNGTTTVSTPASSGTEMLRPARLAEESCEMVVLPSSKVEDVTLDVKASVGRGQSRERELSPTSFQNFSRNEDGNTNHPVSLGAADNLHHVGSRGGSPGNSPKRLMAGSAALERNLAVEKLDVIATPISAGNSSSVDTIVFPMPPRLKGGGQTEALGPRITPVGASTKSRKATHSEVIDRRPNLMEGVALPPKSKTEIFGKDPNLYPPPHHHHPNQQQIARGPHPRAPCPRPFEEPTTQYPLPSAAAFGPRMQARMMPVGGIPGGCKPLSSDEPWQRGLSPTNQPVMQPPFVAEGCVVSPVPTNYSNTLSNISEVHSSSALYPSPHPPQQQNAPHRPLENNSSSSNRLCPVCNQEFSHISMEDFQTHVFDCFDNDDGPQTLQAEMVADYPPSPHPQMGQGLTAQQGRSCPMCQLKFPFSISQAEFEQHVHRHFGEEAFEEL